MAVAKAVKAVGYTCPNCGCHSFGPYTLEPRIYEGREVRADVIDCGSCGKPNLVIEELNNARRSRAIGSER